MIIYLKSLNLLILIHRLSPCDERTPTWTAAASRVRPSPLRGHHAARLRAPTRAR